jgi:putative Ca2+/H+ antiporter (TMEM165/GDT1 family)
VSVLAGALLGASIPTRAITLVAGVAFLGFGAWTLRGHTLDECEAAKADRGDRSAVIAASLAFFLAELGDKTMLRTVVLLAFGGGSACAWSRQRDKRYLD